MRPLLPKETTRDILLQRAVASHMLQMRIAAKKGDGEAARNELTGLLIFSTQYINDTVEEFTTGDKE